MKYACSFMLKALFVLKLFKALSWLFGQVGKWIDGKEAKINFKVYFVIYKQIITKYVLPKISWSKSNQAMEFGQIIDHDVRNIFLQKSCKEWGRETSSRSHFVF